MRGGDENQCSGAESGELTRTTKEGKINKGRERGEKERERESIGRVVRTSIALHYENNTVEVNEGVQRRRSTKETLFPVVVIL